jgi:hypothetical protein
MKRPRLTRTDNIIKVVEDHIISDTIKLVKDDINENILTPDIVSNIRSFSINAFGIFVIICILYLFYQVCLDSYNERMLSQFQQEPDIYAYNSFN